MILQGVSVHVNKHAGELQDKWVINAEKHSDDRIKKKTLLVNSDSFILGERDGTTGPRLTVNDWDSMVINPIGNRFLNQIKGQIHPDAFADLLVDQETGLSGTTDVERVAMGITVMTTLKEYFGYTIATSCGFPYIVLEGEKSDWIKIRESAERLVKGRCTSQFADDWLPALLPLLDKFVEEYEKGVQLTATEDVTCPATDVKCSAKTEVPIDSKFWNAMVKRGGIPGSGGISWFTGWMNILFPYIGLEYDQIINRYAFEAYSPSRRYVEIEDEHCYSPIGPSTKSFPNGLSKVPVEWNYHGKIIN